MRCENNLYICRGILKKSQDLLIVFNKMSGRGFTYGDKFSLMGNLLLVRPIILSIALNYLSIIFAERECVCLCV
jgi:hypothetical protein